MEKHFDFLKVKSITQPRCSPVPTRRTHLVTCLWNSVSCLWVTVTAPPAVCFGNPFSAFSSQRQNIWNRGAE